MASLLLDEADSCGCAGATDSAPCRRKVESTAPEKPAEGWSRVLTGRLMIKLIQRTARGHFKTYNLQDGHRGTRE